MKNNQKVNNFCLKDQNNDKLCIKDIKENYTVLYFYPKDNTSGCTLEAIEFTQKAKEFEKLNTKVIGISPDSSESHDNFCKKHNLSITLLSDPEKNIIKKFDVWQKKSMYGKEFMGVVRSTFLLDKDKRIIHSWTKVNPQGHAQKVFDKIKELGD